MRYDIPSFWHTSLGLSIVIKLTYKVYKLHGLSKTVDYGFLIGLLVYPVVSMLYIGSYILGILAGLIMGFLFAFQYSLFPAWLSENIATSVRYSYIAFSINLGVAFSSFAPYIVTALGLAFHNPVTGTAVFDVTASIIGGIAALLSPPDKVGMELQ